MSWTPGVCALGPEGRAWGTWCILPAGQGVGRELHTLSSAGLPDLPQIWTPPTPLLPGRCLKVHTLS